MRNLQWSLLTLSMLTLLAFYPALSAGFIDFDDPIYVTENPHVLAGLSVAGWNWAWTTFDCSNWHPLTWLSLQLDAQLYGARAAGYHVTNVLLHLASALVLCAWLRRVTGMNGLSWIVAALFAVHPLRVESVGWIAERKDVLSTLLGIVTLFAYAEYVRKPHWIRFLGVIGWFAASLLAKPMWVTLPGLLLLLDFWPLGRWSAQSSLSRSQLASPSSIRLMTSQWWPFVEKLPLCMLTLASCVITVVAQKKALGTLEQFPLIVRIGNAPVACATYLAMTFWPAGLSPYYPYPDPPNSWSIVAGCSLLLLTVTIVAVLAWRVCPAVIVGWCWFLATLIPVIGIVQVGGQAYADRYTYLPHIGLLIAIVWGMDQLIQWIGNPRAVRWLLGAVAISGCVLTTQTQLGYWQNSERLWNHALAVTRHNHAAHLKLWKFMEQGKSDEGFAHLEEAVRIKPKWFEAQYNYGNALKDRHQPDKAEPHLRIAVQLDPQHGPSHQALGIVLAMQGKTGEALEQFSEATRLMPNDPSVWLNLGVTCLDHQDYAAAVTHLTRATRMIPGRAQPLILLASAEYETGNLTDASEHYRESRRLDPNWPEGMNRAAWILSTDRDANVRNGRRAVQMARRVCQATENKRPEFLNTLAAAYAESGRYDDAIHAAEEALRQIDANGGRDLKAAIESHLQLYKRGQAFRQ